MLGRTSFGSSQTIRTLSDFSPSNSVAVVRPVNGRLAPSLRDSRRKSSKGSPLRADLTRATGFVSAAAPPPRSVFARSRAS